MTDDQINVAIAEYCGWTRRTGPSLDGHEPVDYWLNPNGDEMFCPSYCTDLNAMREAQCELSDGEKVTYCNRLTVDCKDIYHQFWRLAHVPARQRAEAFLRVKGLWCDEAPEFGCKNIVTKG